MTPRELFPKESVRLLGSSDVLLCPAIRPAGRTWACPPIPVLPGRAGESRSAGTREPDHLALEPAGQVAAAPVLFDEGDERGQDVRHIEQMVVAAGVRDQSVPQRIQGSDCSASALGTRSTSPSFTGSGAIHG